MSKQRLHLRRIMCNPSRADTTEQTDEERIRTIISLQGGKSFGRADNNDVVMLDGSETVEKEPQFISRCHAKFYHSSDNGVNLYYVEDRSENGTYLNDRRLPKTKQLLKNGDTIKFGHRNGSQHEPNQLVDNPDADFAFRVEMSKENEPLFQLVEKNRDTRVKVFSSSACSKDFGVRKLSSSSDEKVLQQEADSTNACPDMETNGASPSSRPATEETQMPSTSQDLHLAPPKRAPHGEKFSSWKEFMFRASRSEQIYRAQVQEQSNRIRCQLPSLAPFGDKLFMLLDNHVGSGLSESREEKLEIIDFFCSVNPNSSGTAEIKCSRIELADALIAEAEATKRMQNLLAELDKKPEPPRPNQAAALGFKPSTSSAFNSPTPPAPAIVQPIPVRIKPNEKSHMDYLTTLCPPEQLKKLNLEQARLTNATLASYLPTYSRLLGTPSIPCDPILYHQLVVAADIHKASQSPQTIAYLDAFRSMEIQKIPTSSPPSQAAQPVGVIAAAGDPTQSAKRRESDNEAEADGGRHSASSGSTDNSNSSRRRTESEESEIDVVSTDEPAEQQQAVGEESNSGSPPENVVDKLPSVQSVALVDECTAGGTETPSPVLPDDTIRQTDIETRHNLEEASDALRHSTTPRIDAQSTPSAVVSALPTPMSSPLPRPAVVEVADEEPTPSSSSSSSSTAPPPVAPAKETPSKEERERRKEENRLRKAEERRQKEEAEKRKKIENTETAEKLLQEIKEKTRENERKNKKEETTTAAKPSEEPAEPKRKAKDLPAGRRMKQLDDSSVDTESDDDDKSPEKKKKVRRSTRTAKSSPPKKGPKSSAPVEKDDDEEKEEAEEKPKGRRGPKNLKRTASQIVLKEARKATKEGEEEAPKKKRGRKKAVVVTTPNLSDEEPDKEKCGVLSSYCLCAKFEKNKNLQWVECSECKQWFHVWCVRLDNIQYRAEENFICCGVESSREAREAKSGQVHARWNAIPGKKPVPESSE